MWAQSTMCTVVSAKAPARHEHNLAAISAAFTHQLHGQNFCEEHKQTRENTITFRNTQRYKYKHNLCTISHTFTVHNRSMRSAPKISANASQHFHIAHFPLCTGSKQNLIAILSPAQWLPLCSNAHPVQPYLMCNAWCTPNTMVRSIYNVS